MILFVSDTHFGRSDASTERAREAALIDCLRAHEHAVEHLYLIGDIFDQYIEYKHLIPKGFVRFQALLADWTDRGVPITYLVGNHDPWHRDYFQKELGVRVMDEALLETIGDTHVYLAHGDRQDPTSRLRSWLRPLLRHPVPVALYRSLLPGDTGYGLARWVNRTLHTEEISPEKVKALREHARQVLSETSADVVVMGHSHHPELCTWPEGAYLNAGTWYEHRTFGRLDKDGLVLARWNGRQAVNIESSVANVPPHAADCMPTNRSS